MHGKRGIATEGGRLGRCGRVTRGGRSGCRGTAIRVGSIGTRRGAGGEFGGRGIAGEGGVTQVLTIGRREAPSWMAGGELSNAGCLQEGIPQSANKAIVKKAPAPPPASGAAIANTESGLAGRSRVKNCLGLLKNLFQNSAACPSSPRACIHSVGDDGIDVLHAVCKFQTPLW